MSVARHAALRLVGHVAAPEGCSGSRVNYYHSSLGPHEPPSPEVSMSRKPLVESPASIALVRTVSHRLFLAVGTLLLAILAVSYITLSRDVEGGIVVLILATGILGGFVSIQRRLKEFGMGDLQLFADSWVYILLSPLVGGVLALLLYLFFLSGLIQSPFFPVFVPDSDTVEESVKALFAQHADGHAEYAKILFWSFVAGYSERFVTDIIGHFESSGAVAAGGDEEET